LGVRNKVDEKNKTPIVGQDLSWQGAFDSIAIHRGSWGRNASNGDVATAYGYEAQPSCVAVSAFFAKSSHLISGKRVRVRFVSGRYATQYDPRFDSVG
jgi:hypothetical protein